MRSVLALLALLLFMPAVFAVQVGDTLEQVVAEKGAPKSKAQVGATLLIAYPDLSVRLKDNVVVAVTPIAAPKPTPTPPPPAPGAKPALDTRSRATIMSALQEAVGKVVRIINQPAPVYERTRRMRVTEFETWFHPGSGHPDFLTVDIRATQKNDYDVHEFVCLKNNPGVVWAGPELEFNPNTKFFYVDRSIPKKKLTEEEMVQVNELYRIIGRCEQLLGGQIPPASQ